MAQNSGTALAGNTSTARVRSRSFAMTIFDVNEAEVLKTLKYKYVIMGKETCPTTGRVHYQTYVQFVNPTSFHILKKKLPTTHMEVAKGTHQQNINYCKKDNDIFFEDGVKPYARIGAAELRKMTVEEIIDMDARNHRAYIHAKNLLEADIEVDEWKKEVEVIYIQGPSGVGKTEKAKEIIREKKEKFGTKLNTLKYEHGFYNGTGSAKIAVYDDWRDSHMRASEFINLIDYNVHEMNIKGGSIKNKYGLIIITSVQKLSTIYKNMTDEPRKQWERRITVIDMYTATDKEESDDEEYEGVAQLDFN